MWPFTKSKPKIEIRLGHSEIKTYESFVVGVYIDGELHSAQRFNLKDIDAYHDKIQDIKVFFNNYYSIRYAKQNQNKQQSSIWHVLGCMPTTDRNVVEKAFRRMAMVYHPDHGGTSKTFQALTDAKEKALAKCG